MGVDGKRDAKSGNKGLEITAITAIIGFLGAAFFFAPNLSGNVISNMTNSTSSLIGALFFIIELVGTFFYFRNK